MSKDHERFNKFNETYDMYGDGIEEEVIKFLKEYEAILKNSVK